MLETDTSPDEEWIIKETLPSSSSHPNELHLQYLLLVTLIESIRTRTDEEIPFSPDL